MYMYICSTYNEARTYKVNSIATMYVRTYVCTSSGLSSKINTYTAQIGKI